MKKLRYIFIALFLCFMPFVVQAKEKITVYVFRGEGCPHCEEALEFLDSIQEEYGKYFTIKSYETWYNQENRELLDKVGVYLEQEIGGVPFILIGEKTFPGFLASWGDEIKKAIVDQYNSTSYVDIVEKAKDIKLDEKNPAVDEGSNDNNGNNQVNTEKEDKRFYVVSLIVLLMIAAGILVLSYRKKDSNA